MIQLIINSLISFGIYFLVAIGFSLIYSTTRFFHFAHAVIFTAGGYLTFLFNRVLGMQLFIAIPLSICFCILLGCLMEFLVYRPLRRKEASPLVLLLSSLGLYIVLQNIISIFFGDDKKSIRSGEVQEGLNVFGARITSTQILIIFLSIVLSVLLLLWLKNTKHGKATRAVANDPILAKITGINSDAIILWVFAIGSGLAGIGGILVAFDIDLAPTMGMNVFMLSIVAVIIGGIGSIPGAALGALFLGIAQHFGVWKIGSQWQDAIAFLILLVFLLIRPQGFLGKKVKKATI